MSNLNNSETVKKQYANSDKLVTRISIHDKYSTNKMGFGNWIYSNYRIEKGMKVLELGCGTGSMWKGHEQLIGECGRLVLSDFSEGMLETARGNVGEYGNVEYRVIDICDIPFENGAFDVVIANMMLYHVPDLDKGLSEVRRVMKADGRFYCATYGEHGIVEYLSGLLGVYGVEDTVNKSFTMQNGGAALGRHFAKVELLEYADSLEVTDVDDMVDYIYSMAGMAPLAEVPREEIRGILASNMQDGVLKVPKEYGMFIAEG